MFFAGMALGAMAGAAFGIGLMCCVVAGKREDQQMEQMRIRSARRGKRKNGRHPAMLAVFLARKEGFEPSRRF